MEESVIRQCSVTGNKDARIDRQIAGIASSSSATAVCSLIQPEGHPPSDQKLPLAKDCFQVTDRLNRLAFQECRLLSTIHIAIS